jgi:outer membrane protein assembly factor BamB
MFGVSCSPLIESKGVLINVGGKGASVVSFAEKDGEVLWKSQDDPASYSSPIALGKGKERQVIFLSGAGVISLNPGDGALNWRYPMKDGFFEASSTPAVAGDSLLASTIKFGSVGLKLEEKEGKPAMSEAWKNDKLTSYFSTPVAVGDNFYLVTSNLNFLKIQDTTSDLNCLDRKTGKVLWKQPKVGKFHASLIRTANDKLLMLDDFGNLILLEPNEKEYKELARSKVAGETWAHAALSDGRLYVRDDKEVICLQMTE